MSSRWTLGKVVVVVVIVVVVVVVVAVGGKEGHVRGVS